MSGPPTTEDYVAEFPEGQESELLPAAEGPEKIEPYAGATPVDEGWADDSQEPQ